MNSLKFENLYRSAISEWPHSILIEIDETDNIESGLYAVPNLIDISEEISNRHIGAPLEVIIRNIHNAIYISLHKIAASRQNISAEDLQESSVRQLFETNLRDVAEGGGVGWTARDRSIAQNYFKQLG